MTALLRSETRYAVEPVATREELVARGADVVVADGGFIRDHGPLPALPTVVLLEPGADQTGLRERAPGARGWLPTTATGDDLLEAVGDAVRRVAPKPAPPPPREPAPSPRESVALVVAGVAMGAIALSFLWQAIRP